jgi:hypothetical protein
MSQLNIALFLVTALAVQVVYSRLVFSEIHFAGDRQDEAEFVEIFNTGNVSVPLAGVELENGIDFAFPINSSVTIASQAYVVVAQNVRCYAKWLPFFFFFFFFFLERSLFFSLLVDEICKQIRRFCLCSISLWSICWTIEK